MIQEFVTEIESGLGFIFEEDIEKYWKQWSGVELDDETRCQLLEALKHASILK